MNTDEFVLRLRRFPDLKEDYSRVKEHEELMYYDGIKAFELTASNNQRYYAAWADITDEGEYFMIIPYPEKIEEALEAGFMNYHDFLFGSDEHYLILLGFRDNEQKTWKLTDDQWFELLGSCGPSEDCPWKSVDEDAEPDPKTHPRILKKVNYKSLFSVELSVKNDAERCVAEASLQVCLAGLLTENGIDYNILEQSNLPIEDPTKLVSRIFREKLVRNDTIDDQYELDVNVLVARLKHALTLEETDSYGKLYKMHVIQDIIAALGEDYVLRKK